MNDTVTEHGNRVRDARGSVGGSRSFVHETFRLLPPHHIRPSFFCHLAFDQREFSEPCRSLQGFIDPLISVGASAAGPCVTVVHGGQTAFTLRSVIGNIGATQTMLAQHNKLSFAVFLRSLTDMFNNHSKH